MPKILYIAQKYDYGKPQLGFSFEHYNIYDSLIKMNHGANEVIYFPFDEIALEVGIEKMNQKLLETVEKEKPDLCFFFLFEDEIKKETIKKITESGKTITFNWFADDKWRFDNFSKYWAPLFNWVSTDQPERVKDYYKIGFKNIVVGCWGCNHFLYKHLNLPKIYDVSFVGQPHGERKKIINKLLKAGIKVECFGRGWPNGRVSQEELIKIFNQTKINLNFSACSGKINIFKAIGRIFLIRKDNSVKLKNPHQWLDEFKTFLARRKKEIKGRVFEIPGCGSFLLTDYAKGLEKYYKIGKEIACFENINDLIDKIKYYLNNEEEREIIAKAGWYRTLKDHTYEKRLNYIFQIIGLPSNN